MANRSPQKLTRAGQIVTIVTCCAAVVLLQSWLVGTLHLHPIASGGIVLAVVAAFVGVNWLAARLGSRVRDNDDAKTIDPIIAEYRETHAKKQFIRNYEEWAAEEHTKAARVQFLERMMAALVDDGHNFEARMRLKDLEALAQTDAERHSFEQFSEELERRIAERQDQPTSE